MVDYGLPSSSLPEHSGDYARLMGRMQGVGLDVNEGISNRRGLRSYVTGSNLRGGALALALVAASSMVPSSFTGKNYLGSSEAAGISRTGGFGYTAETEFPRVRSLDVTGKGIERMITPGADGDIEGGRVAAYGLPKSLR